MAAYCLFDNIEVLDAEKLGEYVDRVGEVVARYDGRYLTVGGRVDRVEGEMSLAYPVLIEFPDLEAAHRWYDAPDYQPLKSLRHQAVVGNAVFFGADPSDARNGGPTS